MSQAVNVLWLCEVHVISRCILNWVALLIEMIKILLSSALIASSCTNQFRHISYCFILTLISVADGFGKNEQNLILINLYYFKKSW